MKRVSYIFPISHHFRYPFHVHLKDILAAEGVDYRVVYSAPFGANLRKKDTVDVEWGRKVPLLHFGGAMYQCALRDILDSDLVIIQQENRLLINYLAQTLGMINFRRVAFFGHGRNFQAADRNSNSERWKRFWATKVHWWFAYTEETKNYLTALGYPQERITTFNNSVDTSELQSLRATISEAELNEMKTSLGLIGQNVGIYVGGLYAEKRLAFLVASLDLIRARVPNFEFLVVGGGPEQGQLEQAARTRPWLKIVGPKFGREKVKLMAFSHLFLIPGLVGLAILDAGIMGLPVVTTDYPYHSPEIAYLKDGENGVMVRGWENPDAFADAVVLLFTAKSDIRDAMSVAANRIALSYSIEDMAINFSKGVFTALD